MFSLDKILLKNTRENKPLKKLTIERATNPLAKMQLQYHDFFLS